MVRAAGGTLDTSRSSPATLRRRQETGRQTASGGRKLDITLLNPQGSRSQAHKRDEDEPRASALARLGEGGRVSHLLGQSQYSAQLGDAQPRQDRYPGQAAPAGSGSAQSRSQTRGGDRGGPLTRRSASQAQVSMGGERHGHPDQDDAAAGRLQGGPGVLPTGIDGGSQPEGRGPAPGRRSTPATGSHCRVHGPWRGLSPLRRTQLG